VHWNERLERLAEQKQKPVALLKPVEAHQRLHPHAGDDIAINFLLDISSVWGLLKDQEAENIKSVAMLSTYVDDTTVSAPRKDLSTLATMVLTMVATIGGFSISAKKINLAPTELLQMPVTAIIEVEQ
jgi:hypothetical protein